MQDEDIIWLYWRRSETAISETEKRYGSYCGSIARNILHAPQDVEECVNDTWLRAWNAIPPAKPARLAAFLGKITRNLALNRWEKTRAQKRGGGQTALALAELSDCVPGGREPEKASEDAAITAAINAFLAELEETQRKVFVRRYFYLSSIEVLAADFSMSESKVKSMLFRLRKRLRGILEKEGIAL